jgi:pimeloyl-ACP methyl ester carboxylesterase
MSSSSTVRLPYRLEHEETPEPKRSLPTRAFDYLIRRPSAETVRVEVREPDGSTVALAADVAPTGRHEAAEGQAIVLLHAIGLARVSWEWVLPRVAEFGRAWAFDLLGFGESDKPPDADYRVSAQADRIVAALDSLGVREAVWVGNSMGAAIALAAAVRHPERVSALALLAPATYRDMLPLWAGLTTRVPGAPLAVRFGALPLTTGALLYTFVDPRRLDPRHVATYARYLWSPGGAVALRAATQALYSSDLDRLTPRYPEVRCPTLILHGTRDRILPKAAALWLARDLPNARLQWLEGLGHFPQEEAPDRIGDLLTAFLAELGKDEPQRHKGHKEG